MEDELLHLGAQNDSLYITSGKPPSANNDHPVHDASRKVIAKVYDDAQQEAVRLLSCHNACAGLSLPSNVPVDALREVVEALEGFVRVCTNDNPMQFMEHLGRANQAVITALAKLTTQQQKEEV